jgi:hypothetical protein
MENIKRGILPKNFSVNEKYSVLLLFKNRYNVKTITIQIKNKEE